jgi:hypothetical protein
VAAPEEEQSFVASHTPVALVVEGQPSAAPLVLSAWDSQAGHNGHWDSPHDGHNPDDGHYPDDGHNAHEGQNPDDAHHPGDGHPDDTHKPDDAHNPDDDERRAHDVHSNPNLDPLGVLASLRHAVESASA